MTKWKDHEFEEQEGDVCMDLEGEKGRKICN